MFHSSNLYLESFAKKFELKKNSVKEIARDESFAIYDGSKFLASFHKWSSIQLLQILWRYSLSAYRLDKTRDEMVSDFIKIYSKQNKFECFETLESFCEAIGCGGLQDVTLEERLKEKKVGGKGFCFLFLFGC